MKIDNVRLNNIISKLLFVPPEIKSFLPSILSKVPVTTFTFLTDTYFLLVFIDSEAVKRIKLFLEKGFDPFPGLIKPEELSVGAAFRVEKARNTFCASNKVTNIYSFSLGKDSTIILQDHKISVNAKDIGDIEYTIDLAYIISFGDEININNFYDYIEDLVAYSFKQWRS